MTNGEPPSCGFEDAVLLCCCDASVDALIPDASPLAS
jgi:hypothetical protein